jgi:hypothetical protein
MDGKRRECPIVPDQAITFSFGEEDEQSFMVAASHDSIQMFPDPKYTHLRYFDAQAESMRVVWLPENVLADLADMGIPVTIRESITQSEYECYERYLGQVSAAQVIEVEEVPETLTDAEIQFYLDEWGNGDAA